MIGTHHHNRGYVAALDAERSAKAAKRAENHDLENLVRAAASGEHEAWSSIVRRFTQRLSRVARAHRIGATEVEDVVQTTFVRLYEQIDTLRDPNALPAWLDTTARRESLRHLRRAGRERPLDAGIVENLPARPQPEAEIVKPELSAALHAAVGRLSERQRNVIELLFKDESLNYEEISDLLDMPIGSIGPTRGRALARLHEEGTRLAGLAAEHLQSDHDDASSPARYARSFALMAP